MQRAYGISAMLGLLCACGPVDTWYKPGVSFANAEADLTACEVRAVQDVPPNVISRTRASATFTPSLHACYRVGGTALCGSGVYGIPAVETTQTDLNADLRQRVVGQCMADKGYAPVSLPPCTAAQRAALDTPITRTDTLTSASCVTRTQRDSWAIVTPNDAA